MRTRLTALAVGFVMLLAVLVGVNVTNPAPAQAAAYTTIYHSVTSEQRYLLVDRGFADWASRGERVGDARNPARGFYVPTGWPCGTYTYDGVSRRFYTGTSGGYWIYVPSGKTVTVRIFRC